MMCHNLLLFNHLWGMSIVVGNYRTHPEQTSLRCDAWEKSKQRNPAGLPDRCAAIYLLTLDVFRAASSVVKLTAAGEEENLPYGLNSALTVEKIWCFPPCYAWAKTADFFHGETVTFCLITPAGPISRHRSVG